MLGHLGALGHVELIFQYRNLHILRHAAQEEQHGQQQTYLDGDGEVENDGENECRGENGHIGFGVFQQRTHGAPAAHVVGHDDEYAGQTGHGYQLDEGHEQQEDGQQYHGMYDAGHGGAAAVVDVGHGAGDGSRHGNAAEERHHDVGDALADELGVGVVVFTHGTIGHGGREQRLDGAQDGDGEGRREQLVDGGHVEVERLRVGYLVADVEPVADGLDAGDAPHLFHEIGNDRHEDDGYQRPRYLA